MRRLTSVWVGIAAILFLMFAVSCASSKVEPAASYGEDRALIEDLQARYMFALDAGDVDKYVATFSEDGILDIGEGEMKGRGEIRKILTRMPDQREKKDTSKEPKLHPATGRHNITNMVIKVEGNRAQGRAYWFHMGNNNPQRTATLDSYGHYEDEMVKVNGQWLFSKRKIYNEQMPKWAAKPGNPSW